MRMCLYMCSSCMSGKERDRERQVSLYSDRSLPYLRVRVWPGFWRHLAFLAPSLVRLSLLVGLRDAWMLHIRLRFLYVHYFLLARAQPHSLTPQAKKRQLPERSRLTRKLRVNEPCAELVCLVFVGGYWRFRRLKDKQMRLCLYLCTGCDLHKHNDRKKASPSPLRVLHSLSES